MAISAAATGVAWGEGGGDKETRAHDEDESDSTFRCGALGWADLISAAAGTLSELPLTLVSRIPVVSAGLTRH